MKLLTDAFHSLLILLLLAVTLAAATVVLPLVALFDLIDCFGRRRT